MKNEIRLLLLASTFWHLGVANLQAQAADDIEGEVEDLVSFGGGDPNAVLPTIPFEGAFGFSKTILETPRSVSLISAETIDSLSLSAVEDLARVVPGVFTTTRFGIQGGIDVRNVPADTYFRGMRRLSLQGNARSVLAAMDTIEVVKGPPSPIFGMGKIGGYTNVVPKSGRARTGQYLESPEGFFQARFGKYQRREVSFGVGGPASIAGKQGGYYIYGLLEDSETFSEYVPVKQEIIQAALILDDVFGKFRMETGGSYQLSRTAGALTTRITQDLVDNGTYIRGSPLVNLDLNGNGTIGIRELFQASPVAGTINGNNMPLLQRFAWPRDANGNPYPLGQFPVIQGIPQAMYDYLMANPDKDPTGLIRAQGVGGPLPNSGFLPVGFVLDPTTVGFAPANHRRQASFEKEVDAELITAYLDFINDSNPDFTIKNQMFMDRMDQQKFSNQPVSRFNDILVLEDKLTLTRRFDSLPDWVEINGLASVNIRYTESRIKGFGGDYGASRVDALSLDWDLTPGGMGPNAYFSTPAENPFYEEDGTPFTNSSITRFTELGAGVLFDIDLFTNTNILVGGRYDRSRAKNRNDSGVYAFGGAGTSLANPMRLVTTGSTAKGTDDGYSWSISLSHQLPFGLRPYITAARSSIALDSSSNSLSNNIINGGHMGDGAILEAGIKGSFMDNKLFVTVAAYEQKRTDVSADDDDPALINAFATSTETTGVEIEVKWVPTRSFYLTAYFLSQESEFVPNRGANQRIDARTLGFQDIIDPASGSVIYPAEAFLFGGHATLALPSNLDDYKIKSGNPKTQAGLNAGYTFANNLGFTVSGNYLSDVDTGRLGLVRLPSVVISNAGMFYSIGNWDFKVDAFNVTDKRYFKPRTGDTSGDFYMQAMPGLRWQASLRYKF